MSNDVIFLTQLVSIFAAIAVPFSLYRLLVSTKDAEIQLLKTSLGEKEKAIAELRNQSPDALAKALSDRVNIQLEEIARLRADGESKHAQIIAEKQKEIEGARAALDTLGNFLRDSDLVCPKCAAFLVERSFDTVHGTVNGTDVEGDIEYRVYQCGAAFKDSVQISPCESKAPDLVP